MKYFRLCWFILGALVLSSCPVAGQVSTGAQPMGSFSSGPDIINLGNLNMHFDLPVFAKPGRGMPFTYALSFDSSLWSPVTVSGVKSWQPAANWNWRAVTEVATGYISRTRTTVQCQLPDFFPPRYVNDPYWYNFRYHDQFGVVHSFDNTVGGCPGDITDNVSSSTDSSGLTLDTTSTPKIIARDGTTFTPPLDAGNGAGTRTDRNGNQISTTSGNSFIDTLGMTALTVSGGAPNPQVFTYTTTTGTAASVTINYAPYTVQTNFGCSGINEFPATSASLVSSVVYPDGSTFTFNYEATPGFGAVTGRVASIILSTGSTISYVYTGGNNGIICADGSAAGLMRTTTDGATTYVRSGSGTAWTTTFTDGASPGNQTVINFQTVGTPALFLETHRTMNQGASTVLLQTDTCYNSSVANCTATAVTLPVTRIKKYLTLNNGQQSLSDTFMNAVGVPYELDEYDFGNPTHGALLKKTTVAYASLGNGIGAMPSTVTVFDGGGTQKAQQTLHYDETVATATSGVPQHIAVSGSRGNLTSVSQWVDTTGTNLTTTMAYEDTGNVFTSTDPGGHITQFSYVDNFTDTVNRSSHAYVTQVTLPDTNSPTLAHHIVKSQYDANTGRMTSAWDQNNRQTTLAYDSLLRTVQTTFPDGGQTTLVFDTFNKSHTETKIDSSRIAYAYTLVDGYGRPSRVAQTSGETAPYNQQDFCYNHNGQLSFQAYSYQGNGFTDPIVCSGAGDTFAYDGIGRITQLTHSDGSNAQVSFNGRARQIQDEGNGSFNLTRVQQSNALGQITNVCEVTAVNLLGNGGNVGSCGLDIGATGFLTSYAYNTLGNLTTVAQGSLVNRSFSYDSLSRLTSESHPEWGSGAMTYSYSNADGLMSKRTRPAPNQTNPAVTVDTTYAYDEMHRLRTKTYSDGTTPQTAFNYDETTAWGVNLSNTTGRVSSESAASGHAGALFSYDSMGRVINNWQCTPLNCGTGSFLLSYGYDLFGDVTSATNGAGVTFSYSYNTAPRLTGMTSNFVDTTHPATFLSNVHYGRFGVTGDTLGNGLNETFGYNTLGEFNSYTTAPTTPYSFTLGLAPDGNITSATDSVNGSWTYSYDQFNRLGGSTQGANSQTYVYDRYGNRLQQGTSTYVFDTNNRIVGSGVTYDALGNVTNDGVHTYAYDAESRLTKVDGSASLVYQYDAEGRRVHTPNYESVYDLNGRATTLFGLTGIWNYGEIYAGGRHLATYSNSTTYFLHTDWLGTRRVATNPTAAVTDTCTGLPFGDGINCVGTEVNFNRFTDYVHDPESNLEHTLFRQYSITEGRFLTPDPFTGSMDPGNPQSLNRYPYVVGNPINFTDPLGLEGGVGGPFMNGCTLLSGMPDEAFGCPGGGFNVGWDFSSLLGLISHGSGLAGNTVPGNCFLPGACPTLPIPSIFDFLPQLPWNNPCIGSPVSDGCGFGNGFENIKGKCDPMNDGAFGPCPSGTTGTWKTDWKAVFEYLACLAGVNPDNMKKGDGPEKPKDTTDAPETGTPAGQQGSPGRRVPRDKNPAIRANDRIGYAVSVLECAINVHDLNKNGK